MWGSCHLTNLDSMKKKRKSHKLILRQYKDFQNLLIHVVGWGEGKKVDQHGELEGKLN